MMLEGGPTKWREGLRGGARANVAGVWCNVDDVDDVDSKWVSLRMRVSVEGEVCVVTCRCPLVRVSICGGHGLTAASQACLVTVRPCSVSDMNAWICSRGCILENVAASHAKV